MQSAAQPRAAWLICRSSLASFGSLISSPSFLFPPISFNQSFQPQEESAHLVPIFNEVNTPSSNKNWNELWFISLGLYQVLLEWYKTQSAVPRLCLSLRIGEAHHLFCWCNWNKTKSLQPCERLELNAVPVVCLQVMFWCLTDMIVKQRTDKWMELLLTITLTWTNWILTWTQEWENHRSHWDLFSVHSYCLHQMHTLAVATCQILQSRPSYPQAVTLCIKDSKDWWHVVLMCSRHAPVGENNVFVSD